MTLIEYLNMNGKKITEGHIDQIPDQVVDLIKLTSFPNIKIMEIGFNAGNSAEVILKNNPQSTLVSFDIGYHDYVEHSKKYIDFMYPNRHTLIIGNSVYKVPEFIENNKGIVFDVIFIDGGHDYETAKHDFENSLKLANEDTIIILDDVQYSPELIEGWNIGPNKVWSEFVNENKIKEINKFSYSKGRGMCVGKKV
jgi:predicted O-methyltransferase YrrM